jgi:hypothetical protein
VEIYSGELSASMFRITCSQHHLKSSTPASPPFSENIYKLSYFASSAAVSKECHRFFMSKASPCSRSLVQIEFVAKPKNDDRYEGVLAAFFLPKQPSDSGMFLLLGTGLLLSHGQA